MDKMRGNLRLDLRKKGVWAVCEFLKKRGEKLSSRVLSRIFTNPCKAFRLKALPPPSFLTTPTHPR